MGGHDCPTMARIWVPGLWPGKPQVRQYDRDSRAAVPAKATLPQYPMVLHRGGFPDGS